MEIGYIWPINSIEDHVAVEKNHISLGFLLTSVNACVVRRELTESLPHAPRHILRKSHAGRFINANPPPFFFLHFHIEIERNVTMDGTLESAVCHLHRVFLQASKRQSGI